ncbi:MAG: hypothetical protein WAO35_18605 [Terriglobia bacterium]
MGEQNSQLFQNREVRLMRSQAVALQQKDVKNAESSDYLYENTFENDKVSCGQFAFLGAKLPGFRGNSGQG